MGSKIFRDPIHGFISVSPAELKIIDHPIFQRTRNIKQLSMGHYVYHGAEHSRFGHMIGTAHIAGRAFDSLKQNSDAMGQDFQGDDVDRATLRMAALLHDIGHTPFSHALEGVLVSDHEKYSQALVKVCFEQVLEDENIDVDTVNNLITGIPYPRKPYLRRIISGQLDVDRLDYLLRDSYYSGVAYGKYDLDRIISQLAVIENRFVVLDGGYESVEHLIFARYQMYQQVYFHKTKRVFERMLSKCGSILKDELNYPKLEEIENNSRVNEYSEFDDRWFLNSIFKSQNPKVKIIAEMIKKRKHYREIYLPNIYSNRINTVAPKPDRLNSQLDAIQIALKNSLQRLGIQEHEFLPDEPYRSIYKLIPDYPSLDDEGGDSIYIYYKKDQVIEPIEKQSSIIHTFGMNQTPHKRCFIMPEKYNNAMNYIRDTFIPAQSD